MRLSDNRNSKRWSISDLPALPRRFAGFPAASRRRSWGSGDVEKFSRSGQSPSRWVM